MKLRFLAPALPFCLLAACSSPEGDMANDGTNLSAPILDNHADAADPQPPMNEGTSSANGSGGRSAPGSGQERGSGQEQKQSKDQIPLALRGRWGLVPADCTSTNGDNKGLLVISGTTLTFYESRGTLKIFTQWAPDHIRAHFDFSGEGMDWTQDMTLEVQQNGKTLIRRDHGDNAQTGPLRYQRCAA